jgi:alkylhydroperoxidase/carboxymuconolactone decarboxylase family protein YurZ
LGGVPEPIAALAGELPEVTEGFLTAREALIHAAGDLPVWVRELLLAILSAQCGYAHGGGNHLRVALANGLTLAQLDEALGCLVLVSGLAGWERVGRPLRAEAQRVLAQDPPP